MNGLRNLIFIFLIIACPGIAAHASDPVTVLRSDLAKAFSAPRLAEAQLGVKIYSVDRDEVLYAKNAGKLLVPASNNKLLTAAAALICLGPEYQFKTLILADGTVSNGVLNGDLILVGFGDPSSSSRIPPKDPFRTFREWAAKLKQLGITAITGSIIGDSGAFEETERGRGWAWDDLAEGYAAPISALQFNENLLELEIRPGLKAGVPAFIRPSPLSDYPILDSRVVTEREDIAPKIAIERSRSNGSVIVRGALPFKGDALKRAVSVEFPTLYYLSALKYILAQEGIDVSRCPIRQMRNYRPTSSSLLWMHTSAPLSELLVPMMKMSLNLSAETFTRIMGLELRGEGTFAKGREVVEEVLIGMGLNIKDFAYADGSGLSRLNLISADALVDILKDMHRRRHFPLFYSALPIAGIDGTLESRMKRTKAENNVHAKTGSVANVSALTGYVHTADKEMLAFSILTNHFLASRDVVESMQEKVLIRLAGFSRKIQKKSIRSQSSKVRSKRSES